MTAAAALVCGFLLNGQTPKADARLLILMGMSLMLWSMWDLGHLTTAAGEADARFALIIRGAALGLLFTPINNVAFGSLQPHEAQQASGLINLSRQLGGSFGIAVLLNYVTKHTEYHRADLVSNVVAGNPLTDQRIQGLTHAFIARGMSAVDAQRAAFKALDGQVMQQASMLSFNDSWLFILLVFTLVSPAILLLKRPGSAHGPAVDAH
jgi:DHA2 family multidrug resistance protein